MLWGYLVPRHGIDLLQCPLTIAPPATLVNKKESLWLQRLESAPQAMVWACMVWPDVAGHQTHALCVNSTYTAFFILHAFFQLEG
jgi:hypothetical protein